MSREDVFKETLNECKNEVQIENYHVKQQHSKVKDEGDYVKDEALLCPLLSVIEFNQTDSVLEVVLNRLQEESYKL